MSGPGKKTKGTKGTNGEAPPFPFVGAGEAQYFEWADLYVRFRKAPTPAQQKNLAATVPPPIGDLKWNDALLYASSEQAVGRQIGAAYGPKAKLPAALTSLNRFQAASTSKVARFNAHIEVWLEQVHAECPVLIAYRRQDWEAGGTKLSPWHDASVGAIPGALAAMVKAPCARDLELGERLAGAAKSGKVELDAALLAKLKKVCKPLVKELEAEEEEEAGEEAAEEKRIEAALAVPKGYDLAKLKLADNDAVAEALVVLERHLPKLARRLRALPPKSRRLRPGATKAALAATEKALGRPLTPAHRALLEAFDGGTVGKLVFLGTEASGARGRDSVATFSNALLTHRFANNAVLRDGLSYINTKHGGNGAQQMTELHGGTYEGTRSSPKLDNLLDEIVKAGKMRSSWDVLLGR